MAKKIYYLLDEDGRFHYVTDERRDDIPELLEMETETPLSQIATHYHGPVDGQIVVMGESQRHVLARRRNEITSRLSQLRGLLESTDYQVIKCYEAQLLSQPMPYDIQALSQERQSWRDEINELEAELAPLAEGV